MSTIAYDTASRTVQPLATDDLRRCAPSVFAEHQRPGLSTHYAFVSTAQVLGLLENEGWEPVRAREQRVRTENRIGFQMHEVRLARRADLENNTLHVGKTRPEMILKNAHDGSHAYRIDAGLYRLVCLNGLTVADADFAHVAIRHIDVSAESFAKAAQAVVENAPAVLETVAKWQTVELTPVRRLEFARRARELRWDSDDAVAKLLTVDSLLTPVRYGDSAQDLWTTFNVVQENLIRGGVRFYGVAEGSYFRRGRTRPVASIDNSQRLNKALWSLAAEFASN